MLLGLLSNSFNLVDEADEDLKIEFSVMFMVLWDQH